MKLIFPYPKFLILAATISIVSSLPEQNQTTKQDLTIPDSYPPVVSISHCQNDPNSPIKEEPKCKHICTGIIITKYWILTAATCGMEMDGDEELYIRAKDPVLFPSGKYVYLKIRDQVQHPDFLQMPLEYNLQVLRVVGEFNKNQIARIPIDSKLIGTNASPTDRERQRSLRSTPSSNDQAAVIGWALTKPISRMDPKKAKELQRLEGIVQPDACWIDFSDEEGDYYTKFEDRICVDFSPATGPCSVHLGVPLVQGKGARAGLVGILTFYDDPGGCYSSSAALFDLVENHILWIQRVTKSRLFRITNGSERRSKVWVLLMNAFLAGTIIFIAA